MDPTYLSNGPADAPRTIILAHSAGAPMDSPGMEYIAGGLGAAGFQVVRFEFPYMQKRRESGVRGRPDFPPVLQASWKKAINEVGRADRLIIGGRSMGGRIASMIADQMGVAGLVCLGYPFHPAAKPDKLRTAHLKDLRTPTLVLQGTRDSMGLPEEIASYTLSGSISLHYLADGDHSFKPRKSSGRTLDQNLDEAIQKMVEFMNSLP